MTSTGQRTAVLAAIHTKYLNGNETNGLSLNDRALVTFAPMIGA